MFIAISLAMAIVAGICLAAVGALEAKIKDLDKEINDATWNLNNRVEKLEGKE